MSSVVMRPLILILTLFMGEVFSSFESDCPLLCECDSERMKVSCFYDDYAIELPRLPSGTKATFIIGGNLGRLSGPSSCANYTDLTALELADNRITALADVALICMPALQSLKITGSLVQTIPHDVFQHVPSLRTVSLDNKFRIDIIPTLCTIPNLTKVELIGNRMTFTPGSLECFRLLENLSHVDLSTNYIAEPLEETVRPLMNVSSYISLSNSNISSLRNDAFAGFHAETLDLSHNKIKHIPRYAFSRMTNLKTLLLRETGLHETHLWLVEIPQIQVLDLQGNPLTALPLLGEDIHEVKLGRANFSKLVSGSFANLTNLERLGIGLSHITYIERKALNNLPLLRSLRLNGNKVTETSLVNLFLDLVHSPIKSLYLNDNPLNTLNKTFETFTPNNLEELHMRECQIDKILPHTFENLADLLYLDLSKNKLVQLDAYTFQGLKKLAQLTLDNNFMQAIGQNAFHGLDHLETLTLSNNLLQEIDGQLIGLQDTRLRLLFVTSNKIQEISLHDLPTLAEIDVSDNKMYYVSSRTFANLTLLQTLDLSYNNEIRTLDEGALLSLTALSRLEMAHSNGGMWHQLPNFLGHAHNLTHLDITKSLIGQLPQKQQSEIWQQLDSLRHLLIASCEISLLFPGMFSALRQLQRLDASRNLIPSIEPSAFQNVSELHRLNLDHNLITSVNWESFVNLPRLQLLSLADNPLLCTCDILWISQAIATPHRIRLQNQKQLICKKPSEVQNVEVRQLNLTASDCEDQWKYIVQVTFGSLASTLAMIPVYLIWRYRWHIRYTLFLARAGRGRYQEMHDNHNYTYDAFVAYSTEDLPWVKNQLLHNIDSAYVGEGGFKLCLHHRDWLAGVDIAENIVNSIAESRRTIIVLSKEFAASQWCQYELAMAHLRLNSEGYKKDRLLIILLDDIPTELLTPRLIYILGSKTYLTWSDDPILQQLFWKTLTKSLRKQLLYNMTA